MHKHLAQVGIGRLMIVLLLGIILLLTPSAVTAQEESPDLPVGDFRLVIKEEFILEQLETQVLPLLGNLSAFGLTLQDPSIDLRNDNVIDVSVTTDLPVGNNTLTVRPTVSIGVAAAENQLSLTIEGVSLEGLALPASLLGPQIESFQEAAEIQINEALIAVERLGGISLAYIATTEDLLILDFNFDLQFYEIDPASGADE
jgi:hypothetical protein